MDENSRPNSVNSITNDNNFYHYSQYNNNYQQYGQQYAQQYSAQQFAQQQYAPQQQPLQQQYYNWPQNSDNFLQQYYSQYYRDYYRKLLFEKQREREIIENNSLKSVQKYNTFHSFATFNQNSNQLIVLENNRRVKNYCLNDVFIDYLYPDQLFSLLLKTSEIEFPFNSVKIVNEWLRAKQQIVGNNFELKLILRVIQLLIKQKSVITGLDLSDLLYEFCDKFEDVLGPFREILMRGQKRLALEYALNNGLNDHALCLAYLMSGAKYELMISTIRKFISNCLEKSDPIYVLYSAMISNRIESQISFESFVMLLSNELPLNSVEIQSKINLKHLFELIVNVMNTQKRFDFVLSEQLFDSKMDFYLINELLEYSLNSQNYQLLENKLQLISLLFDFGFNRNALQFCQQLKAFPNLTTTATHIIYEVESRFQQNVALIEPDLSPIESQLPEKSDAVVEQTPELIPIVTNDVLTTEQPLNDGFYGQSFNNINDQSFNNINEQTFNNTNEQPLNNTNEMPLSNDFYDQYMSSPMPTNVVNEEQNDFSFISNTNSLPVMPFEQNSEPVDNRQQNDTIDHRKNEEIKPKPISNSSGIFKSLFGKFKSKNEAILPDDTNMTLTYDKNLQQWVDSNDTSGVQPVSGPTSGPPIRPLINSKFEFKSNKRYVDLFHDKSK